jgi:hypothetical protein
MFRKADPEYVHFTDLGLRRHTTQRYTVSFIATTAMCTTLEVLLPRRCTRQGYTPGRPSLRKIHSATMVISYVVSKREFNVTPAGHQKSAGQPDVINT